MDAVIGLGANLGARSETLVSALRALSRCVEVTCVSTLYKSAFAPAPGAAGSGPSPGSGSPETAPQPDYLNAAARISTDRSPRELLAELLRIEREHGRVRSERWGPRTLDLDLLFAAGIALSEPGLTVPHPRLLERAFALVPLLEIAPDAIHPITLEPLARSAEQLPPMTLRRVAGPEWARRAHLGA